VYDGREITATYGTTKYCKYFLRGDSCPKKAECEFLHFIADERDTLEKVMASQDKMSASKHIQPREALYDTVNVRVFSDSGTQLPHACIIRDRAQSTQVTLEHPTKKSRYYSFDITTPSRSRFGISQEESSEQPCEVPDGLRDILNRVSPIKGTVKLSVGPVKTVLAHDWVSDILDLHKLDRTGTSSEPVTPLDLRVATFADNELLVLSSKQCL
jgi:hypothetical protein